MAATRLKTWLFLASLIAIMLGPLLVGAVNGWLDARFEDENMIRIEPTSTADETQACIPALGEDVLAIAGELAAGQGADLVVSLRMAELFAADQAVRQMGLAGDPAQVAQGDAERRIEVLGYLQAGKLQTPRNLVFAAYIFQHGDCPEHYLLAHRVAQAAMESGYEEARWIYAASLDRYLMSLGEPQKYGTQYTWVDGEYTLYTVDPATTDAERTEYRVPPLSEAKQQVPLGGAGAGNVRRQWLASWWLTLIGAGFAALSAAIAFFDPAVNAFLGRMTLVLALLIYPASVGGHYLQLNALGQGTAELQAQVWETVNLMMLIVWLACAVFEGIRLARMRKAD